MNIVTISIFIAATICSTFGAVYLGIWLRQRKRRDYLLFVATAFSVAIFAGFESAVLHASTPAEYGTLVRWAHLPAWAFIVLLAWFVHLFLQEGRPWLLWSVTILRTLTVIINFILTPNINFREIKVIRHVSFLGESISVADTIVNPWMVLPQASLLLAIIFFADAAIAVWRRGDRRRAIVVGGTATFFSTMTWAVAVLIFLLKFEWPFILSIFFTGIIMSMAYELSLDVFRAAELSREVSKLSADRMEAEMALRDLSGKLINAQEHERSRLARELHDDLSQSLALLSIQLSELDSENATPDAMKRRVKHLTSQIQRLSSDVHRLSHELHPAKLEQLGLESALRGFCREISAAHGIKVDVDAENVARSMPNDISLCLYRIAQESLQNIVKHSGASRAHVKIVQDENEAQLEVLDNGSGFNLDAVRSKESIGLISMNERIRSVNGEVTVRSKIGAGTSIIARIPVPAATSSAATPPK